MQTQTALLTHLRTHVSLAALGLALALAFAPAARAEFPVEDMDSHSLGLQYGLAFRGQDITKASVPSHEILHALSLAYSPIQYVSMEAGLGIDRYSVDSDHQVSFQGDYGISPVFGLSLYTPPLFELLRFTAGDKALFLDSEDGRGYRYSGFISNPFLGLIVSPSGYVDVTAGARMLLTDGKMSGPGSVTGGSAFSNQHALRGYLSVTLKSPLERAFLTLDLDASPSLDSDWSNGPKEASVGLAIGAMLGWSGHAASSAKRDTSRYFPAYPEMKSKQDKMAEEIE